VSSCEREVNGIDVDVEMRWVLCVGRGCKVG
jgi:hypothetical protein